MSKVVVYILDKAVWLLLATVLTGQALQLAGIMETPKGADAIEYQQKDSEVPRWKRDATETTERNPFIDMLFNIPIKTLTAMNNLIQNSRPAFRKLRDYAVKRLEKSTTKTTTESSAVQKRSSPVYIREVKEKS